MALIPRALSPTIERRVRRGGKVAILYVIERQKTLAYTGRRGRTFFWRTYTGAELDYVEERDGMLAGFEIKLQGRRGRIPSAWSQTYPNATATVISRDNWLDFLIPG